MTVVVTRDTMLDLTLVNIGRYLAVRDHQTTNLQGGS